MGVGGIFLKHTDENWASKCRKINYSEKDKRIRGD